MNEYIALIVWLFIVIIVFAIMYYCCYSVWASIIFAIFVGLLALLVVYPWYFPEHHHRHEESCISEDETERYGDPMLIFWGIVAISILVLIAYIIGCIFDCNNDVIVVTKSTVSSSMT